MGDNLDFPRVYPIYQQLCYGRQNFILGLPNTTAAVYPIQLMRHLSYHHPAKLSLGSLYANNRTAGRFCLASRLT